MYFIFLGGKKRLGSLCKAFPGGVISQSSAWVPPPNRPKLDSVLLKEFMESEVSYTQETSRARAGRIA
jgi:hypothetical protein